jgi:hypothetical protein
MCWGGFGDCSLDIAIELGVHNLPQVKKYSLSIANFPEDFPVMSLNLRRNVTLSVVSKNLGAAKSNVANCVPPRIQIIPVDTVLSSLHTADH